MKFNLTPTLSKRNAVVLFSLLFICSLPFLDQIAPTHVGRVFNSIIPASLSVSAYLNPVFSTSPSSGQQLVTSFNYSGSNLTPNGSIERWGRTPTGIVQNFGNQNASGVGTLSWNYTYNCSDPIGTHAVWIRDVSKNFTTPEVTNTISIHPSCTPAFTTSPSSGQQLVNSFNYSGSNLTANGVIERWGRTPTGVVQNFGNMNASGAGTLSWNYTYTCSDPTGTHSIWIKDVSKNYTSPEVTNTVSAHTNCLTPSFTTSPSSGQQLVTSFNYSGSNLTANGVIERWGRTPTGVVQNFGNQNATSSGTLSWNYTYTCSDPVGTHSIWIRDVSKNFTSPEVTNTVSSHTNCLTPSFTTTPSSGQQLVTSFSYNGSNLTPNGVVERWGRTPTGAVQNFGNMNATSSGTLSWNYTYTCSDPVGTHSIWIRDVSKNYTTPEVTNTISGHTNCATPSFTTSPSSGQQLVTSFNYSGSNLTANGVIERWGRTPTGVVQNFGNMNATATGTLSWNYTYTCSDPIGTHSIWIKDVSKNYTTPEVTNTVSLHSNCTPAFTTSPSSGQQIATNFSYNGSNLTPNGVIERWGRTPNGTVQNYGNMNAIAAGTLSWNYTYTCSDPIGTHSIWIKDVSKNYTSPEVTNTVSAHTNCLTPSFATSPSSGQQLVTNFSYNGSNLTANGVIERWGRTPNGTVQNYGNMNASSAGTLSWNYTYTCSDPTGTHSIWIKDVSKNFTTPEVTNTVSVNTNCLTPVFTTNPSSGQQSATNFIYNGSNLTPGGVIERWGRTPAGLVQNYGNLNATATGTLTWNYTYNCSDPSGTHAIWIKDISKNFTTPEVTNTVTASPGCIPANKTLVWTGTGTVYWFQNGKLYGITNQSYLDLQRNAGVPGWNTINTFGNLSYPLGPLFVSLTDNNSNGLLLKLYGGNPAVYLIQNQQKRILSLDEFNQSGYSFSNIIEVGEGILNLFSDAPSPTPVPTLNTITPLSSPTHKINFNARLEGANFTANTVEIVVTGPGCSYVNACVVPNWALSPSGVNSTVINNAPFKLDAGTFNVYVRNTSSGSLSNPKQLIVNPATLTPTIDTISFSTTPIAQQPFTVHLIGSGFDIGTVQAVVTGPGCPCPPIENSSLQNKSGMMVDVPLQLNNVGAYQITLRNGSGGTPSNPKPINVVQQQPDTFELKVLVAITDKQWPLDRAERIFLDLTNKRTSVTMNKMADANARFTFTGLTSDDYDLLVTAEYKEPGNGSNSTKPELTRQVKYNSTSIRVNSNTQLDVLLPPIVVMVHGILSGYYRWESWQQYFNGKGMGNSQDPKGFITLQPDYSVNRNGFNTDINDLGGWEVVAQDVINQLNASLARLTSNTVNWPPIYYVGHSQGGLVGRVITSGEQKNSTVSKAVKYMYLLGTPNSGGVVSAWHLPGKTSYEYLTKDQMTKDFNLLRYPDFGQLPRTKVKVFAGNCPKLPTVQGECIGIGDLGDTDGFVPVQSVHEIQIKTCYIGILKCETSLLYGFPSENRYVFPYKHSDLGTVAEATSQNILKCVIAPHMAELSNISLSPTACGTTNNRLSGASAKIVMTEPQQQVTELTVFPRRVYSNSLSLAANQTQTLNFKVGATDLLIVNVFSNSGPGNFSLISPNGQTINLNSAVQLSGAIYEDELGTWFVLDNPAPGQWMAQLQVAATPAQASVSVQERSPVGFEGYVTAVFP